MLQASIVYVFESSRRLGAEDKGVFAGMGALVGILVLLIGIPVFWLARYSQRAFDTRNRIH
jgi:hypothetical protein